MVKVSVIIAAYNIENYIDKCIQSILDQTLIDIEVIVVNDGSTDNTLNKIIKYKDLDTRIVVVNKENGGVQSARNEGLKIARGKSILFVDGDDWLERDALENLYNELENNKLDIVCYGYYQFIEGKEKIEFKNEHSVIYQDIQFLDAVLKNKVVPSLCCKLLRKKFLEDNNIILPENIAFGEDLATTVELACYYPKVSIINKSYYYYYTRIDSVTNKITDKALDLFKAFEYIKNILIKNKLYYKFEQEYKFLAYYHLYFERIIGQTSFNKTHKKFYNICNKKNINKITNIYLEEFKLGLNLNLRIWIKLYDINYILAISLIKCWKQASTLKQKFKKS